jgi:DNA-binding MarR family transcriptional regulator/GNAT superfamily N-acetyltransferase
MLRSMARQSSQVAAVRRFNRFYTGKIGVLDRGYVDSPYSVAEARVLYEIASRALPPAASDLTRDLGIDPGYMSRILRGFERRGLVSRVKVPGDARRSRLLLTAKGKKEFAIIDRNTAKQIGALVEELPARRRQKAIGAMRAIEEAFATPAGKSFSIRTHRPGDMGWVTHRHGVLYAQEYGWDERFEALVARICADFIDNFDKTGERCWIAERDGEILGSIFCVRKSKRVAKLRLLLVEPSARGLGVGTRLVDECISFARKAGYQEMTLWTQNNLHAARRIYERAGFTLSGEEKHESFGAKLVAQVWDLKL